MKLTNCEIEKIQDRTCKVFDELVKNSIDDNISEEERDAKYNDSVEKILFLVEEMIDESKKN